MHDATSTLLGGLCRRLVQLSVCQVRSRINDVCHLAEVNVSILTTNHMFFFASVFQKMTESNVYIRLALISGADVCMNCGFLHRSMKLGMVLDNNI